MFCTALAKLLVKERGGASTSAPPAKSAEGPVAKKAKKSEVFGAQVAKVPKGVAEKPSRTSTINPALGHAKESKGKGIFYEDPLWLFVSYCRGGFG